MPQLEPATLPQLRGSVENQAMAYYSVSTKTSDENDYFPFNTHKNRIGFHPTLLLDLRKL